MGAMSPQSGAGVHPLGDGSSLIGLPDWPRFVAASDGQSCRVTGWHLTPRLARLAHHLAVLSTLAALIYIGWYFWGFQNIRPAAWNAVHDLASKLGYYPLVYTQFPSQQKWVFVGLYVCCWIAGPVWKTLFYRLYCKMLVKRSVVRFTVDHVRLSRFGRRYERSPAARLSFSVKPHPHLPWLKLKAQRRESSGLAVFYEDIRVLVMEYGQTAVPVAYFAIPADAERFSAVCRFANEYPLKRPDKYTTPSVSQDDSDT